MKYPNLMPSRTFPRVYTGYADTDKFVIWTRDGKWQGRGQDTGALTPGFATLKEMSDYLYSLRRTY